MTAADRARRQATTDHAGQGERIEAVKADVIAISDLDWQDLERMTIPRMIARAQYWRGWCIDNEPDNPELVRLRWLLDAVGEHLKDERDRKETL